MFARLIMRPRGLLLVGLVTVSLAASASFAGVSQAASQAKCNQKTARGLAGVTVGANPIGAELASLQAQGWTITPAGQEVINGEAPDVFAQKHGRPDPNQPDAGFGGLVLVATIKASAVPPSPIVSTPMRATPKSARHQSGRRTRHLQATSRAMYSTTAWLYCGPGRPGYHYTGSFNGTFSQWFGLTRQDTGAHTTVYAGSTTCPPGYQCGYIGTWQPGANWGVDYGEVDGNNYVWTIDKWCG